jgi:hypothetical protein
MRARETNNKTNKYTCQYCGETHKTEGWLEYHIKTKHSNNINRSSTARERAWADHSRIMIVFCLVCHHRFELNRDGSKIGFMRYTPDGIDVICRSCFDETYIAKLPGETKYPIYTKGG